MTSDNYDGGIHHDRYFPDAEEDEAPPRGLIYVRHPDGSLYAVSREFTPRALSLVMQAMGDQRAATVFDGHPSDGAKVICRIDLDGLPDTPARAIPPAVLAALPAEAVEHVKRGFETPQEPAGDQLPAAGQENPREPVIDAMIREDAAARRIVPCDNPDCPCHRP
jgi:hypothetical protein